MKIALQAAAAIAAFSIGPAAAHATPFAVGGTSDISADAGSATFAAPAGGVTAGPYTGFVESGGAGRRDAGAADDPFRTYGFSPAGGAPATKTLRLGVEGGVYGGAGGAYSVDPTELVAAPEPGPLAAIGIGLVMLGLARRRMRRRA